MKDAKGHGSNPRGSAYRTKPLASGKIGVFRVATGALVVKLPNQASAEHHIARQEEEDRQWRVQKVNDYLKERSARPPRAPERPSAQLDMFGAAATLAQGHPKSGAVPVHSGGYAYPRLKKGK